jgi:glutaminyl-peptide cyclotransferase
MVKNSWIWFFIALLVLGCSDDNAQRELNRPSLKSSSIPLKLEMSKNGAYFFGDTIEIDVRTVEENVSVVSINVDDHQLGRDFGSFEGGKIKLPTLLTGGGELRLRLIAQLSDSSESTRYKEIRVLAKKSPNQWKFETVQKYPHDKTSFTQGLLIHEGKLYEGTGNYGETRIRKLDLSTGRVLQERELESDIFGEGITIFEDKLYQLTYKSSKAFVYDLESLQLLSEASFFFETGEGWGLTHNDTSLIASDGSENLYFLDPAGFGELKRVRVFNDRGVIRNINEMEYRDGVIYANIYTQFIVVAIDAKTGEVLDQYDAREILRPEDQTRGMDVLNGIAINPANDNLLLTGKYWSKIYEVRPVTLEDI